MLEPIDIIGQSLICWDQFYRSNYCWLYELLAQDVSMAPDQIKDQVERLLVKLLLNKPEVIVNGSSDAVKTALLQISPRIHELVDSDHISAVELFASFYCPN